MENLIIKRKDTLYKTNSSTLKAYFVFKNSSNTANSINNFNINNAAKLNINLYPLFSMICRNVSNSGSEMRFVTQLS